jgi:tetratricopeptide (TPR) repeat protein
VLVLQNLGLARWPQWHYAVVIGFDPADDAFLLRSGQHARQRMDRQRFFATWRRADLWGIVILAPEERPAGVSARAYLNAAAALESSGRHGPALSAFESALRHWPDEPVAQLGKANNHYQLGDLDSAAAGYRTLLRHLPGHPVALHNLVMVLLEQGDDCAAAAALPAPFAGEPELIRAARAAVLAQGGAAAAERASPTCRATSFDRLVR